MNRVQAEQSLEDYEDNLPEELRNLKGWKPKYVARDKYSDPPKQARHGDERATSCKFRHGAVVSFSAKRLQEITILRQEMESKVIIRKDRNGNDIISYPETEPLSYNIDERRQRIAQINFIRQLIEWGTITKDQAKDILEIEMVEQRRGII
jgi:hypothetical protein